MTAPRYYPTPEHEAAAEAIVAFSAAHAATDAVLLVNSCARGKATPDSCLDIVVLVPAGCAERAAYEQEWERFYRTELAFERLRKAGRYSVVHLDITDGVYAPVVRDWETGGPDSFELEVGNHVAYSVALWERTDHYQRLRAQWLPYYGEELQRERLAMARGFCLDNLNHIPLYVARGLYFPAFDRLYSAHRDFLQALFIGHRTYPIAYDKWVREGVVELLGLPELYEQLPRLFEIRRFESDELADKAAQMRGLVEQYAADPPVASPIT